MKNKPFFLLFLAFSLLNLSCDDFLKTNKEETPNYEGLDQRSFWAQDMRDGTFYTTTAARLYEGKKCIIWVELSAEVTVSTAEAIAREYDDRIAPVIVDIFGIDEISDDDGNSIGNSLDYADYLTDGDGKLSILLLDIRDGYKNSNDSYTAGYFTAGNFYSKKDHSRSNEADMMYVDTSPSTPGSRDSYATFAHELQHLINYVNTIVLDRQEFMDIWLDEGLSVSAENIYLGEHPAMRYQWFIEDPAGTISQGNNFFVWGNHEETSLAIMDEYATAYLFFQWLRLQSGGGSEIYTAIANSEKYNQEAVLEAAQTLFSDKEYAADWETLLRTWMAANYINSPSGPFGYRDEDKLKEVRVWTIGGLSQSLYPGEGVYSIIRRGSTSVTASKSHIRYGGLAANGTVDFEGDSYSGERLLTFNINSDLEGKVETGTLTGMRAETGVDTLAASRQAWQPPESLRIDARDISGSFRQEEREMLRNFRKKDVNAAK
jgi:hypothetical protein